MGAAMNGTRRLFVAFVAACTAVLLCAGGALAASPFMQTYNAYRKTGSVPPCQFSPQTLQKAKAQVPPDIEQYAPDFPAALDAALQARARGACNKTPASAAAAAPVASPTQPPSSGGSAPAPAATAATGTPSPTPLPPGAATGISHLAGARTSSGASAAPAPVIALAIVLALMALAALWWSLTSWRGLEPRWLLSARHAWMEASYRASGTWAEFTDWVRFGR
jgi:hypothetical protein